VAATRAQADASVAEQVAAQVAAALARDRQQQQAQQQQEVMARLQQHQLNEAATQMKRLTREQGGLVPTHISAKKPATRDARAEVTDAEVAAVCAAVEADEQKFLSESWALFLKYFDPEKSGSVALAQFGSTLRACGFDPDEKRIGELFGAIDTDGDER
jgi:hypothetical protein